MPRASGFIVWLLNKTGYGTVGNSIRFGLPVAASASAGAVVGSGTIKDASVSEYPGLWYIATSTTVELYRTDTTLAGPVGVSPSFALASGDAIFALLTYEAA